MRTLADWLSALASEPSAADETPDPRPERTVSSAKTTTTRLRLGDSQVLISVPGTVNDHSEEQFRHSAVEAETASIGARTPPTPNLSVVAKRCNLKAECCRWATQRRRLVADGASFETTIGPKDTDLLRRARELPDCYAWVLDPYAQLPGDRELEDMAAAYENVALSAEIVGDLYRRDNDADFLEDAYRLLAESQSALLKSLSDFEVERDQDQLDAFNWLRARTFEDRVYLDRHMKLSDPADPTDFADRRERIEELRSRIEARQSATRLRNNLLGKIRYICNRLPDRAQDDRLAQWNTLSTTVESLVECGVRPSARELREPLLPLIDDMPDSVSPGPRFSEVLASIDRYLAEQEAARGDTRTEPQRTPDVETVARLLRSKAVVLIGGQVRPHSRQALERDLELARLEWVASDPHQSYFSFEPEIARNDVVVVLLAIRWSSHNFENVKKFCAKHGKLLVRLPAGYGSNRVAHEILSQVGTALAHQAGHANKD